MTEHEFDLKLDAARRYDNQVRRWKWPALIVGPIGIVLIASSGPGLTRQMIAGWVFIGLSVVAGVVLDRWRDKRRRYLDELIGSSIESNGEV